MTHPLQYALLATSIYSFSAAAMANVSISFNESAPKDWFEFTNQSQCDIKTIKAVIDLDNSAGKLIFDTTEQGDGVEVFQPFEIREGNISLTSSKSVSDGDKSLAITIKNLAPGQSASFTIDVDDTLTNSELGMIRVTDAEISGGEVSLETSDGQVTKGKFDGTGRLQLPAPICG